MEKKQNQIKRMEDSKRRKRNVNLTENIPKPDFINTADPIFSALDFNNLNLASELN